MPVYAIQHLNQAMRYFIATQLLALVLVKSFQCAGIHIIESSNKPVRWIFAFAPKLRRTEHLVHVKYLHDCNIQDVWADSESNSDNADGVAYDDVAFPVPSDLSDDMLCDWCIAFLFAAMSQIVFSGAENFYLCICPRYKLHRHFSVSTVSLLLKWPDSYYFYCFYATLLEHNSVYSYITQQQDVFTSYSSWLLTITVDLSPYKN